ncbi:MAG: tetratricopeptide repeat protein [Flavobacteriales bacterium]|nr:tetratricopeptide repeat protein [Flavobacteriales bacterium]
MLSLWADQIIGSGSLKVPHFSSILLHGINSILVRRTIASSLIPGDRTAMLVALVFALHPLQVESVAWLAERKTVLSGTFLLLCTGSYLRYLKEGKVHLVWLTALLFSAALLSKPIAVAWPLFLFGMGLFMQGRAQWDLQRRILLPLFILAVIMAVTTVLAQQEAGFVHLDRGRSEISAFLLPFIAYSSYPVRVLLPYDISILHPIPTKLGLQEILFLSLTIGAMVLIVRAWKKEQDKVLGILLMYSAAVLPVIHLVPFGSMLTADRYAYLAVIPIACGVFQPMKVFMQYRPVPLYVLSAMVVMVIAFMAHHRSRMWCNGEDLFAQAVAQYPWSAMAHANLAGQHIRQGQFNEAEARLEQALKLDPTLTEASIGQAQVALLTNRPSIALRALQGVKRQAPEHPRMDLIMLLEARALNQLGRSSDALDRANVIPNNSSTYAAARVERGIALAMLGDHTQAIVAYREAYGNGVNDERLFLNLAISLGWTAQYREAVIVLNELLAKQPSHPEALFLRGIARSRSGSNGCDDLRRAVSVGHPTAEQALDQLCTADH